MTPGEGAAKFEHIFPPFGVGDPSHLYLWYNYSTVIVLTNYVLIKYAINKDVLAQYSCTLKVLVVLIEYHLYVIPSC